MSAPEGSESPHGRAYEFVCHLAQGGMGSVELVVRREGTFRRLYAIKRPHPHHRHDAVMRSMFTEEARLAGLIRHPNVVGVLDVGEDQDGPFLVILGVADAEQIAAHGDLTCARQHSGQVICWGRFVQSQSRRLEDRQDLVVAPTKVDGLSDAIDIAVGDGYACAVRENGHVLCLGSNEVGQLGDDTRLSRMTVADVVGLSDVVQVVAGASHTCARHRRGTVSGWGLGREGHLGDGQKGGLVWRSRPGPVQTIDDVIWLAAGRQHTCARLRTGSVACWGNNQNGQIGDATTEMRSLPVSATGLQ